MTGHRSGESIAGFWRHCKLQTEWKDHPVLQDPTVPLDSPLFKMKMATFFGTLDMVDSFLFSVPVIGVFLKCRHIHIHIHINFQMHIHLHLHLHIHIQIQIQIHIYIYIYI